MKFTRKFVLVSNERYDEMQKKLLEQKLQPEKPDMEENQRQYGSGESVENPMIPRLLTNADQNPTESDPRVHKDKLTNDTGNSSRNNDDKLDIEQIVGTLGKPYRHKARQLLKLMQRTPSIFKWTPSGEIIYKDQIIHGSNIIDLIRSVMYKTKIVKPIGHLEFKHYLRQINVPLTLVNNLESVESRPKTKHKNVNIKSVFKRRVKGNHVRCKKKMWISL